MDYFTPPATNPDYGILGKIFVNKLRLLKKLGPEMGEKIPSKREVPVVLFGNTSSPEPFVICEIKKKSPSAGIISENLDPVIQASLYIDHGVKNISVLTEKTFFGGSLNDLYLIKKQFPNISVLRKDFLLDESEIEISYRAGADAVLIIASILEKEKLERFYRKAISYNLTPLIEIGDAGDIEKIKNLKPGLIGINSRNLKSFYIDSAKPIMLKKHINWECTLVYESGIKSREHLLTALSSGFKGVLVGQSVVQNPGLIPELLEGFCERRSDFWLKIFNRIKPDEPLVKICGITNYDDALTVVEYGADMIGFVFAESPRRAHWNLPEKLQDLKVLKSAVVVTDESGGKLDERIKRMLDEGLIDVIQFHGNENPGTCFKMAYPYYKAIRVREFADIKRASEYNCPRILFDAFSKKSMGGTGNRIQNKFVTYAKDRFPLWLAGGIGPDNIKEIIKHYRPELVDSSSGLEKYPGKKDKEKIKKFFEEIKSAKNI